MNVSLIPGSIKKLKRGNWRFQETFYTPLKNLPSFVDAIFRGYPEISSGTVTIDDIVFEPRNLISFLGASHESACLKHDVTINVESAGATTHLLQMALGDWIDFYFVPSPREFIIYADHDEFCTFYSNKRGKLSQLCESLLSSGFESVSDYERDF